MTTTKLPPPRPEDEAIVLDQPIQIQGFQISTIKMGLKATLHGMLITRGATPKYLLNCLSQYTGKKYNYRKDVQMGIDDCNDLINQITKVINS